MANRIADDPRIDPRIKTVFGAFPEMPALGDAESREHLLAEAAGDVAMARRQMLVGGRGSSPRSSV